VEGVAVDAEGYVLDVRDPDGAKLSSLRQAPHEGRVERRQQRPHGPEERSRQPLAHPRFQVRPDVIGVPERRPHPAGVPARGHHGPGRQIGRMGLDDIRRLRSQPSPDLVEPPQQMVRAVVRKSWSGDTEELCTTCRSRRGVCVDDGLNIPGSWSNHHVFVPKLA
jgi:hypothetical protein